MVKKSYVTIKGTKDGLTLHLDDNCSFDDCIEELDEKLSTKGLIDHGSPLIAVTVKVGNRFLTTEQENVLRDAIRSKKQLVVGMIESDVVSKQEALELLQETSIHSVVKIVRSGQVIEVDGDLLLIGDVNPGGKVVASGNIFVLGNLRGIAHAGVRGNKEAIIAASVMKPTLLMIHQYISRSPDHVVEEGGEMECAFVGENEQIMIDRLQALPQIRPNISMERGQQLWERLS